MRVFSSRGRSRKKRVPGGEEASRVPPLSIIQSVSSGDPFCCWRAPRKPVVGPTGRFSVVCERQLVRMSTKKKSIFETIDDLLSPDQSSSSASSTNCSPDNPKLTCQFCKKTYLTYFGLRRHLQFHKEGKLQQSCPHCKKVYRSPGALKMHLKTHSLPCVCTDCGKSFSRPWLLKGHLRTHTGEKPFECEFCGRCFADRSNLRAHLQTHSGEKKHRCSRCGASFARVQVRQRHEQCCRGDNLTGFEKEEEEEEEEE